MAAIRLENVSKNYGQTHAVTGVNLAIESSTFTVLLGRSGCGKTTTLRLVAGLEKADAGDIWIGDQHVSGSQTWVPATKRQVGMVFQDYALFPHLDVVQNVAFGLNDVALNERKARIATMVELVGLTGMEDRYPHQLSGGQQQRVALARALAPSPDVILLDEPFSNLDASLRQSMREEVREILREANTTTIFVTHDQEEALRLADKLVVMADGSVLQQGSPEDVYRHPASLSVAQFLGEVNILSGEASLNTVETAIGRLPLTSNSLTGPVDVVLRPEDVTLIQDFTGAMQVDSIRYFGFHNLVMLRLPDGTTLQARTWSHNTLKEGDAVRVTVDKPTVAFPKAETNRNHT